MKKAPSRFLSLLLALIMTLALAAPAFAVRSFTDVDANHWAWGDIQICVEQGTVTGFQDGSFRPNDPVTSAQFMSMVCRTFYADKISAVSTPDGQPWYYPYAAVAYDLMLDERFGDVDDTPLNRYRMAVLLQNVSFHERERITRPRVYTAEDALDMLDDWDAIHEFGLNYEGNGLDMITPFVHECIQYGLLTGMEDGCFHGEQTVTRAQACAVMIRLMDLLDWPHAAAPARP